MRALLCAGGGFLVAVVLVVNAAGQSTGPRGIIRQRGERKLTLGRTKCSVSPGIGVVRSLLNLTAGDAWELMRRLRLHHLLVKEGSELIGVIWDRDLGSRGGGGLRAARRVADLMTRHVVTLTDTIRRAANVMRGRTIGCIPVTQGRRLVGIVTVSDLLELLGRGADRPIHAARADLHYRVPHRKRARSW